MSENKKTFLNICLSQLSLWSKVVSFIVILVIASVLALLFRMSQGPIDLDFIKPQIEAALSQDNANVTIGKLGLTWPSLQDPILFDLDNVQVAQEGKEGLKIENAAFSISSFALLSGKISPKYILIERPVIYLYQKDGALGFLWSAETHDKPDEDININRTRKDAKTFLNDLMNAEGHSTFSNLKQIELKQAIVKEEQFENNQDDYLALIDLTLEKNSFGLQGNLTAMLPKKDGEEATLESDVLLRAKERDVQFSADLKGFNPAHFSPFFESGMLFAQQNFLLNGKVDATFDQNLKLQNAAMNLTVPEGEIYLPETYDAPVPLKDIVFDGYLDLPNKSLDVKNFSATVNEIALTATAKGKIENGNISAPVELKIPSVPLDNVPPIFPKSHLESSAGEWLTKKLSNGRAYDVVLKTDFIVSRDPETGERDANMANTRVDFKAEGVTVKYSDTLMPVTEAKAEGYYENDVLVIKGTHGKIGDITGTEMDLKMSDLSVEGGGLADIKVKAVGPLKTALEYASDEPIEIGDKLGFDLNKTKGTIDFDLALNFPTIKELKAEQVQVVIDGKITNLLLPSVVQGLDLTGGPYDLGYKDGVITLKGNGALGGYAAKVDWMQYFDSTGKEFESKIMASVTSDRKLREIFGIGLEDYISGALPVDVVYTDFGEKAVINVKGDLTPTAIHIDPLAYKKAGGVAGEVTLKAHLIGQDIKTVDSLFLNTKDFSLKNGSLGFKKLSDGSTDVSKGKFPGAKLGKTQVDVDFEVTNGNVLKIVANGPVIDIGPFLESKKPEEKEVKKEEKPMMVSASAPRVLAKDGEELKNTKFYLETNKTSDITRLEMDSDIGSGSMYLRFKPEEETGKRTFRMESSDAGYTMKAFGLYDKMRGGKITIYGVPQSGDLRGDLYGSARIDNFRIKSAPALAKLLGAMSLNGANDLLRNDGVSFARLESDFEWHFRDKGNFLVMKDGRTSGSSLGLTFDGSVDQATNEMNVKGTIVPVSGVNKAIGSIPLVGNILTGGDALIAATYTMSGQASDPKVSVNPLSVLAPGFLRKILFEGSAPKEAPAQ